MLLMPPFPLVGSISLITLWLIISSRALLSLYYLDERIICIISPLFISKFRTLPHFPLYLFDHHKFYSHEA